MSVGVAGVSGVVGVLVGALLLAAGPAVGASALQVGVLAEGPPRAAPAATPRAAGTSRAAVIIDTGQRVFRTVITFDGSISGAEALQRAGADPVFALYAGKGAGVCSLLGVGHGSDDCFGVAAGDGRYWGYFRAPAGSTSFRYWGTGASSSVVSDGDVEGWAYGVRPSAPAYVSVARLAGDPAPGSGSSGSGGGAVSPAAPGGSSPGSVSGGGAPAGGSPDGSKGRPASSAGGGVAATDPSTAAGTPVTVAPGVQPKGARADPSGAPGARRAAARRSPSAAEEASSRRGAGGRDSGGPPASLVVFGLMAAGLAGGVFATRRARSRRT